MVHVVQHVAGGLAAAALVMACVAVWTLAMVALAGAIDTTTEGDPE